MVSNNGTAASTTAVSRHDWKAPITLTRGAAVLRTAALPMQGGRRLFGSAQFADRAGGGMSDRGERGGRSRRGRRRGRRGGGGGGPREQSAGQMGGSESANDSGDASGGGGASFDSHENGERHDYQGGGEHEHGSAREHRSGGGEHEQGGERHEHRGGGEQQHGGERNERYSAGEREHGAERREHHGFGGEHEQSGERREHQSLESNDHQGGGSERQERTEPRDRGGGEHSRLSTLSRAASAPCTLSPASQEKGPLPRSPRASRSSYVVRAADKAPTGERRDE